VRKENEELVQEMTSLEDSVEKKMLTISKMRVDLEVR